MPRITIKIYELRNNTLNIIQKLLLQGNFQNEKEAFKHVQSLNRPTGFPKIDLEKSYNLYRRWKSQTR